MRRSGGWGVGVRLKAGNRKEKIGKRISQVTNKRELVNLLSGRLVKS
jgi:hypothetical protein